MKPVPRNAPITGSWRIQSRDPQRLTTDVTSKRRTSSLPKRLVWGRIVRGGALLGIAGLAAVGVVQVASWVEKSDALPVRTVAVRASSAAAVSPERSDEILAYAGVKAGQPLFAVDTDAVAKRVLEHPFVASATVRRVPPDGVEIVVGPRDARALLAVDGVMYLVDERGQVMKTARAGDGLDLPVITGLSAADIADSAAGAAVAAGTASGDGSGARSRLTAAVALLASYARSSGSAASELHVDGAGFELVLDDGARVRLGERDVDAKIARLAAVMQRLAAANRKATFIYLDDDRRPERAAVRLRPERESSPAGGNKTIPRERG